MYYTATKKWHNHCKSFQVVPFHHTYTFYVSFPYMKISIKHAFGTRNVLLKSVHYNTFMHKHSETILPRMFWVGSGPVLPPS